MRSLGFLSPRQPIPLPQRLRLLCAAKRVERVGSDAGAILGLCLSWSEELAVIRESRLGESESLGQAPHGQEQAGKSAARAEFINSKVSLSVVSRFGTNPPPDFTKTVKPPCRRFDFRVQRASLQDRSQ